MKTNQGLLNHPFWATAEPSQRRLVRISEALPSELNPFADDDVVIKIAGVPGEAQHSKWIIAREGILQGIRDGLIGSETRVVEATSGNTGEGMAKICNAIDVPFVAVMSIDVPHDKLDAIRVIGRRTGLHILSDTDETTVQYARRLGAQEGWHNPCQYEGEWNWRAHYKYLAPQLWTQQVNISLLFVPSGTMGTSVGLQAYVHNKRLDTKVVPVLCAGGEEVPGARTLSSVKNDVRLPWEKTFREEELEFGMRHESFLLSFLTWKYVVPHLGPTSGLAFAGALRFLQRHKNAGTLEQFRNRQSRKIEVVVFGPDDCRPYMPLYFGELKKWEFSVKVAPSNLLSVLGG